MVHPSTAVLLPEAGGAAVHQDSSSSSALCCLLTGLLNLSSSQRMSVENVTLVRLVEGEQDQEGAPPAPIPTATALPLVAGMGRPLQVFLCASMVAIVLLALLGNALVCLMVYQRSAMRSAINILLASLALADALLAALSMPVALLTVAAGRWLLGEALCRLSAALFWLLATEGAAMLLVISVDRFLIIARRQDQLSPRRAKLLAAGSWVLALTLALPLALGAPPLPSPPRAPQCVLGYSGEAGGRAYALALTLASFFAPFGVMLYTFLGVAGAIRHNAVRVHSHPAVAVDGVSLSQVTGGANKKPLGLLGLQRPFRVSVDVSFKTRAFATILLLFAVFAVCWAPLAAYSLAATFSRRFYGGDAFFQVSAWVLWLCYLKSALNPLIYYWRIRKFRDACLDLLPRYCKFLPPLPGNAKRRIQPSAVYVCGEHRAVV
ncbi:putative G-protein coupled receptor 63 [Nelusetta ayraudi]|uniref:putative G-protein coupled receptor 63 n=1 Tax=Nelusetta ayraudi TaxID=303726 RepID=UPI003F717454